MVRHAKNLGPFGTTLVTFLFLLLATCNCMYTILLALAYVSTWLYVNVQAQLILFVLLQMGGTEVHRAATAHL